MAKLTMEFDTVAKTASFSIDGAPIDNVSSMSMYHRHSDVEDQEDLYEISLYTEVIKNPVTGMRERTYLYASESQEAAKAALTGDVIESSFAGLVEVKPKDVESVQKAVAAYFGE